MVSVGGGMGDKQQEEGWFIYSFVARGTIVLAEFTEYTGNFPAIAAQCLQRLPASNNRYTYACDHHTFNFLLHDGYVYCVVAKESVPKHISMALLERVKADFKKRYGGGKADTAIAKSLNKEFGSVIKEHMQYTIEHADEIEKLLKVKAQISEIKSIMFENIEKAIDRGEKLNELAEKTTDLHSQAQDFRKQGTKIRKKMWFHNMKIKLLILGILLLLVLIIWVSICQGFNCTKQEDGNANTKP
ncbi:vesicle-associated membrane protein 724 [Dendrobium catenatum]|uniref:Vesicle-associated membrane protein 724 n=1 Tax=Dendrobium catenatum TaxID=906689 RepID=A0A2I0VRU6_9ASPA|nr:vesicle-associated membrane protein 724 [Dendrobium catenatum]XP_020705641.1 vesicle-associated membrane protein 724 [Dendrobium catenatum]XP_020705642.1 vesicle-associated membrane protein 724 [Dendrobium catenatum]PKU66124.1 Vesicle-associated membrane protein 724 [Dendrobium catenatum]